MSTLDSYLCAVSESTYFSGKPPPPPRDPRHAIAPVSLRVELGLVERVAVDGGSSGGQQVGQVGLGLGVGRGVRGARLALVVRHEQAAHQRRQRAVQPRHRVGVHQPALVEAEVPAVRQLQVHRLVVRAWEEKTIVSRCCRPSLFFTETRINMKKSFIRRKCDPEHFCIPFITLEFLIVGIN